ncbi:MAG: single-stranded-DNA-specific exonuclease RecJ, partial [Sedimentisphaerales bacterium]|nr:single-stranded-DNA-specific exonuclease RecJ [Sedimentisphaerales bacterium]
MTWRRKQRESREKSWRVAAVWEGREELAKQLHVPRLVAQLLYNRGIRTAEEGRRFLQPSLSDLIEPDRMGGMAAAVKRIHQALQNNEKIVLYGDYDVDGITGVAILWRCLKLMGREVDFYVPHRLEEGYGLNDDAMRQLAADGAGLIITVDCGISAVETAALARRLGVDLIITDHHKMEGAPPEACAVVHPNLPGETYPNPYLCGAGVAFKLAWALSQHFTGAKKVSTEFREFLLAATSLAALGTIADVVELVGENRVIASWGLQGLAAADDPAIKALIQACGLTGAALQATDIGFRLAPRLNAAGRMGHARLAMELFTRAGEDRAREIARYLESQNAQRQKVEKQITEEALTQIKTLGMDGEDWRGIVAAGEKWHGGVVGIVANRIVDRYHRPAVVIAAGDEPAMGSCRSVAGVDMCAALEMCREHLLSFGGHTMAAGLKLSRENIDAFRAAFNEAVGKLAVDEETLTPTLDIEAEVTIRELDVPTVAAIDRLGPFGQGNPHVRLVARNLR